MIYTFRLSALTGTSHTFTLNKKISFKKATLVGVKFDEAVATGEVRYTELDLPIYLFCDKCSNDDICFNNGMAGDIGSIGDKLIPFTSIIADGIPVNDHFSAHPITLINAGATYEATDTITFGLYEINNDGAGVTLCHVDTLGVEVNGSEEALHHGCNIIVHFDLHDDHNHNGDCEWTNSVS